MYLWAGVKICILLQKPDVRNVLVTDKIVLLLVIIL